MKRLVAIAIAALAVIAIVAYFGRSSEPTAASASKPEQPPPLTQETGSALTPTLPPTPPTQPEAPIAPTTKPTAQLQTFTPPPPADPRNAHRAAAPLTKEERQQLAACAAASERKTKSEQAARDAEQKDPAWAYRMEEKLREYTAHRFRTVPVEVTSIDCKTTFCDLRAQSFSPETGAELSRALNSLIMQPPADFRGMSFSNMEEAGETVHVVRLNRNQGRAVQAEKPDAQQERCWKIAGLQAERERAARDAEPRDSGWADPMEQLLRQHITAALARHPIESLEIACRSTYCEIKAGGRTPESREAFQKVSQEVGSEAWADVTIGEGGSSGYGDRWEAQQMLYRKGSGF